MNQRSRFHRAAQGIFSCAHCWSLALMSLSILGLGAAIAFAHSPEKVERYNLSVLGVDPRAAPVFNGTLIAIGLGFFILALLTGRVLQEIQRHGRLGIRHSRVLIGALIVVGIAWIVAGLFRQDSQMSAAVHQTASFAAALVVVGLMLTPPGFLGALFGWASRGLVGVLGGLFALSNEHLIAYAVMELAIFFLIGLWLCWFQIRLRAALAPV